MNFEFRIILHVLFGVLPSLVWLFYYLRKDLHPEPKRTIAKVFSWGALITIPVLFIQVWLSESLIQGQYFLSLYLPEISGYLSLLFTIIKWFFIIALSEEIAKYLVVRLAVLNDSVLDEPLDVMIYMIVAALGFAALENFFYLFSPIYNVSLGLALKTTIAVSFIRFIGATFLHTLVSAAWGYFLAMSFFETPKRLKLTVMGLLIAVLLHGLYNFSIITLRAPFSFIIPIVVIAGLAVFVVYAFDKVKKLKSISKI